MRRHEDKDARTRSNGLALLIALVLFLTAVGPAAAAPEVAATPPAKVQESAEVVIDGRALFAVIGVPAYPAKVRARTYTERIQAIAEDRGFPVEQLRTEEEKEQTWILAGDRRLLAVVDADAALQGTTRTLFSQVVTGAIAAAITSYRQERTSKDLLQSAATAAAATALLVLFLWATRWLLKRSLETAKRRFRSELEKLEAESFGIVEAERFESVLLGAVKALWWLLAAVATFACVISVLRLFPWTRGAAHWLFELVVGPLRIMLNAVANSLPDLVFLAILYVVVQYLLRILELFFAGVGRGAITLSGFAPEWAMPTFKLVRVGVIVFAIVVAYPYIPGSNTEAFKGVSVLVGVLVSLGSSSIVANILSGYVLLYRRTFKVGDRVKFGNFTGSIRSIEAQVTRLCTIQNEEIVIPNSLIVSREVVNYSKHARARQLVLHSAVSIGYDAPWRQVEAMLIEAARRTGGLLETPEPFVLKLALDDFYVRYEVNAYCGDADRMSMIQSELHANIIDVFNEYGVQIMSPHHVAQPGKDVTVPKAKWFDPPAKPPAESFREEGPR
ncbi:mechanosensitive ion channel domain-containing protein [uncultured Piscinibacter sp.]|uniref:mechanosensitive ion channel family protein n=1 Tax=uncultured Piscinibacter sp. TaxID=1131835 RepID=UPI0026319034|nr:mechanosensitive ion channel domain-containing protein [uncultured Piscinibacter sp.]